MKKIALIHTVKSVAESFGPELLRLLGGNVRIYNLWDEFLSVEPNETGVFTENNKERLLADLRNAERTGADLIATTCSTLTPYLEGFRPLIGVPVVAIDDAMAKKAVSGWQRIAVLATAPSTIKITADKLYQEACAAGRSVTVESVCVPAAFEALNRGEREKHDELVLTAAGGITGCDGIVLAQASMAHLTEAVASVSGAGALSSPALCMEQIRTMLCAMERETGISI